MLEPLHPVQAWGSPKRVLTDRLEHGVPRDADAERRAEPRARPRELRGGRAGVGRGERRGGELARRSDHAEARQQVHVPAAHVGRRRLVFADLGLVVDQREGRRCARGGLRQSTSREPESEGEAGGGERERRKLTSAL